jgi:hypothetical protein
MGGHRWQKKRFSDGELLEDAVIQSFWITAADGKSCDTKPRQKK